MAEVLDGLLVDEGQQTSVGVDIIAADNKRVSVYKLLLGAKGLATKLLNAGPQAAADSLPVVDTSSTILCGSRTAIGATALQLSATSVPCKEVVVQAANANATTLVVGNATTQTYELKAGEAVGIPCTDVNLVYVKALTGSGLVANYLGRV